MSENPRISIIMPSYNQGAYLETAIRSVLTQNYPNKELILIDGGSTDQSVEIIRRYRSELSYSVSEPDRGQSHALNKALSKVSGEIIGWLNSDDCYLPGAFSRVERAFQQNRSAVLIYGDRLMIDEDGLVVGWSDLPAFDPAVTPLTVFSEASFWRKSACDGLLFNENLRFAMDLDYFGRLYRVGPFMKISDYFGYFRCHAESKSSTLYKVGENETKAVWNELFKDAPDGWKRTSHPGGHRLLRKLLQYPALIARPYLYRRFILGKRKV